MHFTSPAIVLSTKKHAEHDAVVRMLTRERGLYAGIVKGAASKAKRGIYAPGNIVNAQWKARLEEQLGMWQAEMIRPVAAHAMSDPVKLAALESASALTLKALHERDPHPALYDALEALVTAIAEDAEFLPLYARFELTLLKESGFGLDIERCALTGEAGEIAYVSPKTGRGATAQAAAPYREKLLALPAFLREEAGIPGVSRAEVLDGLLLTGYFLGSRVFQPHGWPLPAARGRLVERVRRAVEL